MILRAFALSLALLAAAPAGAEPPPAFTAPLERGHPLAGTIWRPATGETLTPDQLRAAIAGARVVLLGETHDNPDHHALQAWLVRAAATNRPVVAFEMIAADKESALRDHLAQTGDTNSLGSALEWEKSGWPDWTLYRPIADAALASGGGIASANLSRDDTRALGRGSAPELARALGIDQPPPPALAAAMADEIKTSHCGMLPDKAVAPMVLVQRARDATMAQALARALDQAPAAILIAGAGHTRTDRGVPLYLDVPKAEMLSVAFVEVQQGDTDPAAYGALYDAPALPFDIVMFTPRAQRDDPCEAFRKHMEKKAGKPG